MAQLTAKSSQSHNEHPFQLQAKAVGHLLYRPGSRHCHL